MTADREDTRSGTTEGSGSVRTIPEADDAGKVVVDSRGEEIGRVTTVEGDTMFVDPEQSITERISSALDWDTGAEDDLPITPEFVEAIEDRVVLGIERDEEFRGRRS